MIQTDSLLAWLSHADGKLLLFFNGMHTPFLDQTMWLISDRWVWVPLYLLLAWMLVRRLGWRRGLLCVAFAALAVAAADQTCATLLRPLVGRLRPSSPDNPLSALVHVVNGYRGGMYGFPSCHAANTLALAVYLSLCFRHRAATLSLMAWALLVSYSRLYLGVHYPGDLLCGMVVDTLCALALWGSFRFFTADGVRLVVLRRSWARTA